MESMIDIPTEEDRDFIVEDGYNHDEDPTYEPELFSSLSDEDSKYVVTGKEFKKLIQKAKKLGAESLDYSTRKNSKYVVTLPIGKKIHFGSAQYPDFLIHKDEERKEKYLARAKNIKNKQGELTFTNPESANFWSVNLLWPENDLKTK